MAKDGEEIRYRGVRKRKWGKYVAEIRSLGSYPTPQAAARDYDTALFCLRGPNATSFNFPDSPFISTAMDVATTHSNPSSHHVIRAAVIAVGSALDTIPRSDDEEAGPSTAASASIEKEAPAEAPIQSREAAKEETHQVAEEEENDAKYLLQSPEYIPFEESVQMAPLQPDWQFVMQPYDQSELSPYLANLDAAPKRPT